MFSLVTSLHSVSALLTFVSNPTERATRSALGVVCAIRRLPIWGLSTNRLSGLRARRVGEHRSSLERGLFASS